MIGFSAMRHLVLCVALAMLPSPALVAGQTSAQPQAAVVAIDGVPGSSHPARHSRKAEGVSRNSKGKIQRDPKVKAEFRKTHPCPSTGMATGACPGYEIDHRQALACRGADIASNMQWLTKAENRHKAAKCER